MVNNVPAIINMAVHQ